MIPFFYDPGDRNRIKHIGFEPCAQSNVPSSPEFRSISRKKWLTEVFGQSHTKQISASDHNIHAAGKLHIKLQRIGNCPDQDHHAMVILIMFKDHLYDHIESVCNYDLLEHSPYNTYGSLCKIFHAYWCTFPECISSLIPRTDRSLHDLRKKSKKQCYFCPVFLRMDPAPVHICHVSDSFQCVKRDSNRNQQCLRLKED